MNKKILVWLMVLAVLIAAAGCAEEAPAGEEASGGGDDPLRIGVLFTGSIGDGAWNEAGYDALVAAEEQYGIEFSFQESVSVADSAEVMRNFAYEGYDLIIAHDFGYNDTVTEVAAEFPDIMFSVSYGYKSDADNIAAVTSSGWQFSYIGGALAGHITETGNVGVLSATDSAMGRLMRQGFIEGVKKVDPSITVQTAFTGSWDDVVKGKELVNAMIEQGADVIFTSSGNVNVGVVEACREAGILAIGSVVDMTDIAPDTVVASATTPPNAYVAFPVQQMAEGELEAGVYVLGIEEGAEDLVWNPAFEESLPQETVEAVETIKQQLIDGEIEKPTVE